MSEVYEFSCPNCGARIAERTLHPGDLKRCRACHTEVVIPPPPVDRTPYGLELASRVADHLASGNDIAHNHPYFCGVGLGYRSGEFLCGYVEDGRLDPPFRDSTQVIRWFPDRAAFVSWLAAQSDDTLHGHGEQEAFLRGNQRITRERLESAVGQRSAEPGTTHDTGRT